MTSGIEIHSTPLEGLALLQRRPLEDERGWFERMFCLYGLEKLLGGRRIVQINRTLTRRTGTVRGMHYQRPPHAECKFVSCLRGAVFDVAVDLRRGSPSFLAWHGEVLSGENHRTLVIPEGFAHGFQTLTDDCELLYLHTHPYVPAADAGINADDPRVGIRWPLPVAGRSARDAAHPWLTADFEGIAA